MCCQIVTDLDDIVNLTCLLAWLLQLTLRFPALKLRCHGPGCVFVVFFPFPALVSLQEVWLTHFSTADTGDGYNCTQFVTNLLFKPLPPFHQCLIGSFSLVVVDFLSHSESGPVCIPVQF